MTVKHLMKLICKYSPASITFTSLKDYYDKIIVIDMQNYIFRMCINEYKINKNCHIFESLNFIHSLLEKNNIPLVIFDGQPNNIKKKKNKSNDIYNNVNEDEIFKLSKYKINEIKNMLSIMGITYVQSYEESDPQCAILSKLKLCDYVISDDLDLLLFGCNTLLKKIYKTDIKYLKHHTNYNYRKNIMEISLPQILKDLDMNQNDLINLSLLLGTDYSKSIKKKICPFYLYELFMASNKDLNIVLKKLHTDSIINNIDKYIHTYTNANHYYKNAYVCNPYEINIIKDKNINYLELKNFILKYTTNSYIIDKYCNISNDTIH